MRKQSREQNQTTHDRVICDDCGMNPIVGIRYKCIRRYDYDLCEKCEAKQIHSNENFIKIRKPLPHHDQFIVGDIDVSQLDNI